MVIVVQHLQMELRLQLYLESSSLMFFRLMQDKRDIIVQGSMGAEATVAMAVRVAVMPAVAVAVLAQMAEMVQQVVVAQIITMVAAVAAAVAVTAEMATLTEVAAAVVSLRTAVTALQKIQLQGKQAKPPVQVVEVSIKITAAPAAMVL